MKIVICRDYYRSEKEENAIYFSHLQRLQLNKCEAMLALILVVLLHIITTIKIMS